MLVYSLSKVFQRESYTSMQGWQHFYDTLMKSLTDIQHIDDCDALLEKVGEVRQSLNEIDGNLGTYIQDVFRKAEINKAFKMYEHGLSGSKIAQLLGISLWDFASYMGSSHMTESHIAITMPEKERLQYAEEFFS